MMKGSRFSPGNQGQDRDVHSCHSIQLILEGLDGVIRQENEMKDIHIRKRCKTISVCKDGIILYIENAKE